MSDYLIEVVLASPPPVAITVGLQGPAGPPGADGDGVITLLASGALGWSSPGGGRWRGAG